MEDLAVEVALLHDVAIDDLKGPHPGGGQIGGNHRSEPTHAGNEDPGRLEFFLPRLAEHEDLPVVSFPLFVCDHHCFNAHVAFLYQPV